MRDRDSEKLRVGCAASTVRVEQSDAILFDLDGVLTDTATIHERAWARMFAEFFAGRPGPPAPYTDADYFTHIDGRPRLEGVRALLRSRDVTLPEGRPDDGPDRHTVVGLGRRKNALFAELIRAEGVRPYPGSVALLDWLVDRHVPMAVVSSSHNAAVVLDAAGLRQRFDVIVDGAVAARCGLGGKPAPDTYLYAAGILGAAPTRTVVVEDAISGVRAGRAAGCRVIGVDRGVGRRDLLAHGASHVVDDLAELISPARADPVRRAAR